MDVTAISRKIPYNNEMQVGLAKIAGTPASSLKSLALAVLLDVFGKRGLRIVIYEAV